MIKIYDRNGWLVYALIGNFLALKLLNTRINANLITLIGILCGIFAGFFLAVGKYSFGIFAIILLQLAIIADYLDGTLARLKNEVSPYGHALDSISGQAIFDVINLSLGVMFRKEPMMIIAVLVILSSNHLTYWIDKFFRRHRSIIENEDVNYFHRILFDFFVPTHTHSYYLLLSFSYLVGYVEIFVIYSAILFLIRLIFRIRRISRKQMTSE